MKETADRPAVDMSVLGIDERVWEHAHVGFLRNRFPIGTLRVVFNKALVVQPVSCSWPRVLNPQSSRLLIVRLGWYPNSDQRGHGLVLKKSTRVFW